jgi:uncharacterized RDD family membrane protein YckC
VGKFRAHYQNQDIETLHEFAAKELTEEARADLLDELQARGVAPEEAEAERMVHVQEQIRHTERRAGLAPLEARLAAFVIDTLGVSVALALVLLPLQLIVGTNVENGSSLLFLAYLLFRDAITGQSLGKRLMSIRVVNVSDGTDCSAIRSLGRNLTLSLGAFDLFPLVGTNKRRLGDWLAGTEVIKTAPVTKG